MRLAPLLNRAHWQVTMLRWRGTGHTPGAQEDQAWVVGLSPFDPEHPEKLLSQPLPGPRPRPASYAPTDLCVSSLQGLAGPRGQPVGNHPNVPRREALGR